MAGRPRRRRLWAATSLCVSSSGGTGSTNASVHSEPWPSWGSTSERGPNMRRRNSAICAMSRRRPMKTNTWPDRGSCPMQPATICDSASMDLRMSTAWL